MAKLQALLRAHVDKGPLPGAAALVAHGDQVEVQATRVEPFSGAAAGRACTI